jgi:hypothetical protein
MVTEVVEYWVDGRKVTTLDELYHIVGARSKKEMEAVCECLEKGKQYKEHLLKKVYGMPAVKSGALIQDPCVHRLG